MNVTRAIPARMAFVVAALCLAGRAHGQIDTKSKAPIDVTANEAEVINSKCLAIWRGTAEAMQGDSRLRADTISVYSRPKAGGGKGADGPSGCGGADRIVADGHVYYVNPQQSARGDHAVYSQASDEIIITGNVIVVQGDDVARGERLVLKVATREATMQSGAASGGHGRVRGVFYPNRDTRTASPSANGAGPIP